MFGTSSYGVEVYGGLPQVSASSAPASSEEIVYHYARSQSKVLDFVDPACPLDWSHPLNRGLVGCWSTLPNSGWGGGLTLRDITGRGSNGTLTNFASPFTATSGWIQGHNQGRKALAFDGSNDYVDVPTTSILSTAGAAKSYCLWAYWRGTGTFPQMLSNASGTGLIAGIYVSIGGAQNGLSWYCGGSANAGSTFVPPTNTWFYVAFVYDGTTPKVYYNGVRNDTSRTTGTSTAEGTGLQFGSNFGGNSYWAGSLEDIRKYNRALSDAEVQALYQEQLRGSPETLRWVGAKTYFLPVAVPPTTTTAYGGSKTTELVDPACPVNWSHPLNRGLIARWTILPNSGWSRGLTLVDIVRGGKLPHNGTLAGGTTWVSGRISGTTALAFDDTDGSKVSYTAPSLLTGDNYSWSMWWYPRVASDAVTSPTEKFPWRMDATSDSSAFSWNHVNSAYQQAFYQRNTGGGYVPCKISETLAALRWWHIVGTFDGSTLRIYVNGRFSNSASCSGLFAWGGSPIFSFKGTNGLIQDPCLYSRALLASEISQLYQEQLRGSPETLNWVKTKSYYLPIQETPRSISYGGSKSTELVDPACPLDWSHPLNRGLISRLKVIPNSGWRGGLTLRDLVRGGKKSNNGTLVNVPTLVGGGKQGYGALNFASGSSQYVNLGTSELLQPANLTACLWVRRLATWNSANQPFFWFKPNADYTGNGWYLEPETSTGLLFVADGFLGAVSASTASDDLYTLGEWTHIAVTFAVGGTVYFYKNGKILTTSGVTGASITATNDTKYMGVNSPGYGTYLNGQLDDACIFNRALTAAEVKALYQEQLRGSPETLNWVKSKSYYLPVQPTDSSSGAYTLTCSTGSYSVIGVDPGLEFGRLSALAVGSYTLSGVNPNLKFGRKTSGATGSYAITGVDSTLKFGHKLTGSVGSYTISGVDPNLKFGRKAIPDVGSYVISGVNPTLRATRLIVPAVGSYSLTGVNPTLKFGHKLIPDTGLYNLTGVNPSLEFNRLISITTGLYNLTGVNAGLVYGSPGNYIISCGLGTYTISGANPNLKFNRIMSFSVGSYGLTGVDASLEFGRKVIANTGSYNVTGVNTSLKYSRLASLVTGSYAITGGTLTLRTGKIVSLSAGSYGLSGTSLSFSRNYVISIGIGSYTITGVDATLTGPGAEIVEIAEFTIYLQRTKTFTLNI